MASRAHYLTLCALLALAVVVLLGGSQLARRTETIRVERDREALRSFGLALHEQLQSLEKTYESHLRLLVLDDLRSRQFQDADRVVGVRQISFIHPDGAKDTHHRIAQREEPLPQPTFAAREETGLRRKTFLLPIGETLDAKADEGWITLANVPPCFWIKINHNELAVVMIDPNLIAASLDDWVKAWAQKPFQPVIVEGGPDQLLGYSGAVLARTDSLPENATRANYLQPIPSRWGTWHLASWDRFQSREHYDHGLLAASVATSVFIALLGIIVFVQQARALRRAEQRVSFVNRVSHELRTPLTNIQLNIDLAAEMIEEPEAQRRLSLVREESARLGRLIANVLTFSQGKSQPAHLHACVPNKIFAQVLEQFLPGLTRRGITVKYSERASQVCTSDGDAIAQIFANLLSNVEKYAPNSEVRISAEQTSERLSLVVEDSGPGIPADEAQRIFLPFERVHSELSEGVTGTGLGLAIAREIAERLGGTLQLMPSERGAKFELQIPAQVIRE